MTRTLRFDGEKIHVRGEIRALADFDGRELNHSIPFASDGKRVSIVLGSRETPLVLPKPVDTPTRPKAPTRSLETVRWNQPPFRADRILLKDVGGATLRIVFDRPYEFRLLAPFRYRTIASSGGSFVMRFPAKLKQGEIVKFAYSIEPGEKQ